MGTSIKDLTVTGQLEEDAGMTLGVNIPGHGGFILPCGGCGAYKNNIGVHPDGDFLFCRECSKIVGLKAGCDKPGCPCGGGRAGTH